MKEEKSNRGRTTKYKPEFNGQAYDLCLLGCTDKMLAEFFEVNEDTINEWKKVHAEFSESVRGGKLIADSQVAAAMFKRAIGFQYDEVTYEKLDPKIDGENLDNRDPKLEVFKKKIVTKMVPGDVGAQMNWLTNRQKETWRKSDTIKIDWDSLTDEQLTLLIQKLMPQKNETAG
jgi:hypothetical protein